jgi:hypothetical protein
MIVFIIEADLFFCDLRAEAEERIEHRVLSIVNAGTRQESLTVELQLIV